MQCSSRFSGKLLKQLNHVSHEFVENNELTKRQQTTINQLKLAVYPRKAFPHRFGQWFVRRVMHVIYPGSMLATSLGRRYKWASPQWSILIKEGGEVTATVGMHVREINSNLTTKKIGGVGGVMTHPAKRRRGLASIAMREAVRRFHDDLNVSYALLFCRPHLMPFYRSLNWKTFEGKVFVNQPEGRIDFTSKGAMVLDIREHAPLNGILDLNGLPW